MPPPNRTFSLDWLRLALASQVVGLHIVGLHPFVVVYPVGAFVCISGYLIPDSFARSRGWPHFAWKRALRVMPVFLLSLALVAVVEPSKLWLTVLAYLTMNVMGAGNANNALWSLMAEEILYATHALTRPWYGRALAWTGLAISMVGLWLTVRYSYLPVVSGCFFAGNLIALHPGWRRVGVVWIAAVLLAVAGVQTRLAMHEEIGTIGRLGLPIIGATALLMLTLRIRLPELRADYSYSLYALHLPVLHLFPGSRLRMAIAAVTVLPVVCALVWRFVEVPALRLKDWRPFSPERPKPT
ncbi:MAG TPA: acyltransferase family protein [Vicinamibacterales bacterium]|nr:acyltransferase family protein [Vicinamibacterales bacterium]